MSIETVIEIRCFACSALLGKATEKFAEVSPEPNSAVSVQKGKIYLGCPVDLKETYVAESSDVKQLWAPGKKRIE